MLNKEQLSILNDIFHTAIKPAFEENEEALEAFMEKVGEHENWIRVQEVENYLVNSISSRLITSSSLKYPEIKSDNFTMASVKHRIIDVNSEKRGQNILSSSIQNIITTKISTQKLTVNSSAGKVSKENKLAS